MEKNNAQEEIIHTVNGQLLVVAYDTVSPV